MLDEVAIHVCAERGPPNDVMLSSRRHEVLRGTAVEWFSESARRVGRATTAAACLLLRLVGRRVRSPDYMVVSRVTANPAPQHTVFDVGAERSVLEANADRPILSDTFEVE